ncbi:homoserine dehydrogenase [bacterium]|nr:homoserine dehydrogenase [bacterium]
MDQQINVGLLGWGTVGTGVTKIFQQNADLLAQRTGIPLFIKKIADLDLKRDRGIKMDSGRLTTKAEEVINDPDIQIIVELIGGIEPAKTFILQALQAGKHVVTANKALLAEHWDEIHSTARKFSQEIYFEASVGGGIPVVQGLNEGLAANRIQAIYGIINGTANYILTEMGRGRDYTSTLAQAQEKGYAEADPALDVEGGDTKHKLVILASLALGKRVEPQDVYVEGITRITDQDILYAREEFDQQIKLLGIAKQTPEGSIQVRVHPTLIPAEHLLASVHGVYNGIYVVGDSVGATMFYGKGAGEMPTASAVVSDIIFIARSIHMGAAGKVPSVYYHPQKNTGDLKIEPVGELISEYYLRFNVKDEVGVIAKIAGMLGEQGISIASVIQKARHQGNMVPVVIMTYEAREKNVRKALEAVDRMPFVMQPTLMIRVEKFDE